MKLILEFYGKRETCASAGGIAALDKKALNDAVKDGFIVVAFEA